MAAPGLIVTGKPVIMETSRKKLHPLVSCTLPRRAALDLPHFVCNIFASLLMGVAIGLERQ